MNYMNTIEGNAKAWGVIEKLEPLCKPLMDQAILKQKLKLPA